MSVELLVTYIASKDEVLAGQRIGQFPQAVLAARDKPHRRARPREGGGDHSTEAPTGARNYHPLVAHVDGSRECIGNDHVRHHTISHAPHPIAPSESARA